MRVPARVSRFSFSKASFYIKEQIQKYKFEIWLLKSTYNTILDPTKTVFLVFEENPLKTIFSLCSCFDSALKTIDTQMFFWLVCLKMHKKSYWPSKSPFWPLVFLCVFKNTDFKKLLTIKNAILADGFFVRFQKYWSK